MKLTAQDRPWLYRDTCENRSHWSCSHPGWIKDICDELLGNDVSVIDTASKARTNEFFITVKNPVEYYIIEGRYRENKDISLPSSGLAIRHVDELWNNRYEDLIPEKHYECSIVQADNRFDLEKRVNAGDAA